LKSGPTAQAANASNDKAAATVFGPGVRHRTRARSNGSPYSTD
jgi:hypothetical protein